MKSQTARQRRASLLTAVAIGLAFGLSACAGERHPLYANSRSEEAELNAFPANYKSDILGGMHAYLNDPTGIRDAAIAEPALKAIGGTNRYTVCLQFNAKKNARDYAGIKTVAAVFLAGRLDHFADTIKDACNGAVYAPFPELQKLPP